MKVLFELKQTGTIKRNDFPLETILEIQVNPRWLDNIVWTDVVHYELKRGVTRDNCWIWSINIPQVNRYSTRTLWFKSDRLVRLYITFYPVCFVEQIENGVMVTGQRLLNMLRNYAVRCCENENIIFGQDGARLHIFNPVFKEHCWRLF